MYDSLTKVTAKSPRGGITCPDCSIQNLKNAQYCNGCGSQLLQMCSNCKRLNPTGSSFCNKCGSQLGISYNVTLSDEKHSEVVEPSFQECKLSEYKVKINYPSTWTRIYNEENPKVKAIFQFQKDGAANHATVFVGVDDTVGNMTLDTFMKNNIASMRQERADLKLIESTPSTLSGFPAHQMIYSIKEVKCLNVSTIKDNVAYSVMYATGPENYVKFLSSAEQMISSFELL
jgi:Double zinc ribbon